MKTVQKLVLPFAIFPTTSMVMAAEFPSAPPNLKEIEAQGLPRLSAQELKGLFRLYAVSSGT